MKTVGERGGSEHRQRSNGVASDHLSLHFMIVVQKREFTKSLSIVRKERVDSAKPEILIGIEVPTKERIRMDSGHLWSKPRMRCN
jgi:hypothetical protein